MKQKIASILPPVAIIAGVVLVAHSVLVNYATKEGVIVLGKEANVGAVKIGGVASHTLRLVNLSLEPVAVEGASGCSCDGKVYLPKQSLPPLSSTLAEVKVPTEDLAKRKWSKSVTVKFHKADAEWSEEAVVKFETL